MDTEEKNNLNKIIRNYDGVDNFILSLRKQLKSSKYLKKEKLGKREIKVLSDKQYEVAKTILNIS
jgi:hypothetical protein